MFDVTGMHQTKPIDLLDLLELGYFKYFKLV